MSTLIHCAILVALLLASGNIVLAQPHPAPSVAEDKRLLPYVRPGQLADIGGRRINLRCLGDGEPTIVLMAGLSSWSVVWYKTQPGIAQRTRACAFDRAGYGFSDPAPEPENLSDVVDDLHAALEIADVPGPYVLVGHSLGGLEARVFAERWPQAVAGMVLLDTSSAGERLIEVNQPGYDEVVDSEGGTSRLLKCVVLAADGPLDSSDPDYAACAIGPLPDDTPSALRKVWPSFFSANYAAAKLSLLSSLYTHRYDSADHLNFEDKPLIVLSADLPWSLSEREMPFWGPYAERWYAQHEALARLSSRGAHRVTEHSGHEIELDKPQAVIDAVDEVLRQLP